MEATSSQSRLEKQRLYQQKYRREGRERAWRRNRDEGTGTDDTNTTRKSGRSPKYMNEEERKAAHRQNKREYAKRMRGLKEKQELESDHGDIDDTSDYHASTTDANPQQRILDPGIVLNENETDDGM